MLKANTKNRFGEAFLRPPNKQSPIRNSRKPPQRFLLALAPDKTHIEEECCTQPQRAVPELALNA